MDCSRSTYSIKQAHTPLTLALFCAEPAHKPDLRVGQHLALLVRRQQMAPLPYRACSGQRLRCRRRCCGRRLARNLSCRELALG